MDLGEILVIHFCRIGARIFIRIFLEKFHQEELNLVSILFMFLLEQKNI